MTTRAALLAVQLLIAVDQAVQVALVGLFYLVGVAGECPAADETISSYVGRGQIRGRRWALVLAPVIDRLFILFGSPPGHCRRTAAGRIPS